MLYKSNGKILLSSEYLVLDGAKSIALPAKKTQDMLVTKSSNNYITWESYDHNEKLWFAEKIISKGNELTYLGKKNIISDNLLSVFKHIQKNKDISYFMGNKFITKLNFNRNWGLGTSSTFINNLAKWAEINPYELLFSTFEGSGYDIACCDRNCPVIFSKKNKLISINEIKLGPVFENNIFLIYLGVKQNTQNSINSYYKRSFNKLKSIHEINSITEKIINCKNLYDLENLIELHESIISNILSVKPIQESKFKDYQKGKIKSLGSWGGDFILATTKDNDISYFKNKGFKSIYSLSELVYIN
tara:strand:- start:21605 stop:22513 length:909 start_codon:yes stop_codon:yes gene_type:complete